VVERATRYVRVVALPDGYRAGAVRRALTSDLAQLPPALRRSLTWDRGREMAEREQLAVEFGLRVFFCDPKSPWQRGSNENTNRLLRQYLVKGADLRALSAGQLEELAARTNTRPRRVLGWEPQPTPSPPTPRLAVSRKRIPLRWATFVGAARWLRPSRM